MFNQNASRKEKVYEKKQRMMLKIGWMAILVSAGLFILVRNAVAETGTSAKAVPCINMHLSFIYMPLLYQSLNNMGGK